MRQHVADAYMFPQLYAEKEEEEEALAMQQSDLQSFVPMMTVGLKTSPLPMLCCMYLLRIDKGVARRLSEQACVSWLATARAI